MIQQLATTRLLLLPLAIAALLFAVALPAAAGPIPVGYSLDISIESGASTWNADETSLSTLLDATTTGDVTLIELLGSQTVLGGDATINDWDSSFDPDPFITNNFTVTNNSGVTQTYTISASGIIPAFNANEIVQSNIILTLNDDDNANQATVSSVVGTPVYEAFVNGGSELTFLPDPFTNTCTDPTDCISNGISVGAVASQALGPIVATSIGITITFDLSAGDSAAVQSRFEIVPEPGTGTLLALGLVGVAARRRRR